MSDEAKKESGTHDAVELFLHGDMVGFRSAIHDRVVDVVSKLVADPAIVTGAEPLEVDTPKELADKVATATQGFHNERDDIPPEQPSKAE